MSSNPTVCAVMLANGRPEMVGRAIASFMRQEYPANRLRLLIFNTGPERSRDVEVMHLGWPIAEVMAQSNGERIGTLRNRANLQFPSDIICHWDSDDWSHPNRIAEQVALLQSSGADCVGYREMLFWEQDQGGMDALSAAWLYSHPSTKYALGTSLCYWRRVWEANPFIDGNQEDFHFVQKVRTVGIGSIGCEQVFAHAAFGGQGPRMIASIHGGNTCSKIEAACDEWTRVPAWDEYCRRMMEGA